MEFSLENLYVDSPDSWKEIKNQHGLKMFNLNSSLTCIRYLGLKGSLFSYMYNMFNTTVTSRPLKGMSNFYER